MNTDVKNWEELGVYLRDRRERSRVSLPDAAKALHIRAKYLEALETGNLSALPGEAYVKGYLRAYAAFLGLDVQEAVGRFEQLVRMPRDIAAYYIVPTRRENVPSPRLVAGSLAAAVILLIGYAFLRASPSPAPRVEELPERYQALLRGLPPEIEARLQGLDACFSAPIPHSDFCTDIPLTLPDAMEPGREAVSQQTATETMK